MRTKQYFIFAISTIISVFLAGSLFAQNPRKNILFIAVDDLKPLLGSYGDTLAVTPHIDKLADAGTIFSNNHCQQAVCAPSRASIMTGLRPDRTKVWDLDTQIRDMVPDILTMPQHFMAQGYETAGTGKIFDSRSVDALMDEPSWSVPFASISGSRWINATGKISTESGDVPDDALTDGKIALKGVELMQQLAAGDKPFFLAVGFKKPHLPFVAPQKYWDMYDREKIGVHPFQQHAKGTPQFAFQPGWELRSYDDIHASDPIPEEKQKEIIHGYYACVSYIDTQIGLLLDKLDELGLREDTIIVLWGDHGWHLGDHNMWAKHSNFEQATRSPLIISAPGFAGNQQSNSPTEFVDVFPTLCALAGIPVPADLDGVDLTPVLEKPEEMVKDFAISQFGRNSGGQRFEGYALRDKRYRYIEWLGDDFRSTMLYDENKVVARELYDYQTDPLETVNLVDSASYQGVVLDLQTKLVDFFSSTRIIDEVKQGEGHSEIPNGFELLQNYPNPFNPSTTIRYKLHRAGKVELSIYNMAGQHVQTLVSRHQQGGSFSVRWDGRNAQGLEVGTGIYISRLSVGSDTRTSKLLLIR